MAVILAGEIPGVDFHPCGLNTRAVSLKEFLEKARADAPAGSARAAAAVLSLDEMRRQRAVEAPTPAQWSRAQLSGRLVEVSGIGAVASLTAAVGVVLEAQVEGEPAAWICAPRCSPDGSLATSTFFPPDLADNGVDLDALIVVRAPTVAHAGRAADRLLRSGGFGLIVLDLGPGAEVPMALQGRLVGLAQRHDAAILCLTEKANDAASIGSMVSLRAEAKRVRGEGRFTVTLRALKDKQRGPGWIHGETLRGPAGT
jgi:recombination protein RecA